MPVKCYIPLLSVLLFIVGCKPHSQEGDRTQLLDYKYFTIRVPKAWKRVNVRGVDSFVSELQIDQQHRIGFDLGWYSNPLDEGSEDYFVRHDSLFVARMLPEKVEGKDCVFNYKGKPDNSNIAPLQINQKQWLQVDGYKAKLIIPKQIGKGTTGVYIDSLWGTGDMRVRFELDGFNLNANQQQQLVAAIKTLKFFQHPDKRKAGSND